MTLIGPADRYGCSTLTPSPSLPHTHHSLDAVQGSPHSSLTLLLYQDSAGRVGEEGVAEPEHVHKEVLYGEQVDGGGNGAPPSV